MHGALCFHDRKGLAVFAIEDVVDVPFALAVGHAGHLDLGFDGVFGPTGVSKVEIDIASARFVFGDFIGIERLGIGGFRFRGCELRPEAANLFLQPSDLVVFLLKERFPLLDGFHVKGKFDGGDFAFVESALLVGRPIAVIEPLHEIEQASQRDHGILR